MAVPRIEKGYERYAWILLFVTSALSITFVLGFFVPTRPLPTRPLEIAGALAIAGLGISGMVIARIPFRKGERWAWYTLWYLLLYLLVVEVLDLITVGEQGVIVLVILFVLGLLLPYRKFFPRK